jgi:hypothetical protein
MLKHVVSLVTALSAVSAPCLAGFARADSDTISARAIGLGESLRAAASGSLATTLNPAGLSLSRSYVIEGGYGYRPDDKSHIQNVSICDSVTTRVGACLYYTHLSADPGEMGDRSLHEVGLTTSLPLGSNLSIGITQRYVSYSESVMELEPIDASKKGYLLDAGMMYRLFGPLTLAVVGYNLVGADEPRYARALGGGLAFSAGRTLLLAVDARYDFGLESARLGGGAEYVFSGAGGQHGLPLRLGYVYDSEDGASYITGGAGFMTPRVAIDFGARKQLSEGDELMLQLSLRLFLPN